MELMQQHRTTGAQTIPLGWCIKRVQDLGEVITGGTPNTSVAEYWGGQHPWITPTDITHQRDLTESGRMLTDAGLKVIRILPANSVLVTCIASIGKNAVLRKVGGCNQQINAVIPNEENNPDFLYYMFEAAKIYLQSNAGITATSIVSKAAFQELKFALPLLPEQRAIATALSDVDALIAGLERLIAKNHDIKQAAMQQLLTGQTRLPGFSGGWELVRLGNVASLKNGYMFRSETYIPTGDYKVITIANVQDGHMISEGCSTVAAPPIDIQRHQELRIGDILISMTGNVGRVCRVSEQKCLLNQRVGKLEPRTVTNAFLFSLLRQSAFIASMIGAAKGGAQPNLSASDINEYVFFMPKDEREQTAIASVLADMDADLAALESRLAKTRAIKQGMMQELLTGRTRLVEHT
jgi:type I restriction enzyme, S subunit